MNPLPSIRSRVRLLAAAAGLFMAGCSAGRVQIVPWMRNDIQPREPLVGSIEPQEAWYWQGTDGRLNVVLARRSRSLLGRDLDSTWVMSLVLEDMPAGREKLYRASARTIRVAQSFGGDHRRAKSVTGVVVIERSSTNRLKGRFHVWLRQQQFTVLDGWAPPLPRAPLAIAVGRFEAIPGSAESECERLLELTEANGFDRALDVPATTRPPVQLVPATATATAPG